VIAQPLSDERSEIGLVEFGGDRSGVEEMFFDEFAELVGDAMLVVRDDRSMRNRQAERPAKQRDYGVPIRQPADGGRFRESREVTKGRMLVGHDFGEDEQAERSGERQRGGQFHAAKFGGALGLACFQRWVNILGGAHEICPRCGDLSLHRHCCAATGNFNALKTGGSAPPRSVDA
jgi:hypothetical protein